MKNPADRLARLENELALLQVKPWRAHAREELAGLLDSICAPYSPDQIACEPRPWVREICGASRRLNEALSSHTAPRPGNSLPIRGAEGSWGQAKDKLVGITGVDYALADSGTLVLLSARSRGRWLSLTPRLHLALLPEEHILDSLDDFFSLMQSPGSVEAAGSAITFITGPSRTADIELKLVMGAHGPKEVHVITLLFPLEKQDAERGPREM
jgi:L-lactate dehydrogenase complex protein LldG